MIQELFKNTYEQYDKEVSGYVMDNGEYRFRLSSSSSAYIRTESKGGSWQKSHFHTEQTEHFIVEKGTVMFATIYEGKVEVKQYVEGDYFFVSPLIPHNMCLSESGITHTVKFGGKADWNSYPELDKYLKRWKE